MFTIASLREKAILQIPAVLLTVFLMWLLPFLVHLVPLSGPVPLGARLLPIFYAPLLAAWLFHPAIALIASLFMPFITHVFTGMPTLPMSTLLSLELTVFSLVLPLNRNYWPKWPLAPLAFVLGKVVSAVVLVFVPILTASPWAYLTASLQNGLPGLLILLLLHLVVLRFASQ